MRFRDLPRGLPGTSIESGAPPRALWLAPAELKKKAGVSEPGFWEYLPGKKIFLGATEDGTLVGISDNRHLLTVAGSRAGKGISAIIPNLLTYEGSVLVLDPKGENASLTAERRGQGRGIPAGGMNHEIHVLDPFLTADVPAEYRSGFNPIALLDPSSPAFIDDCDSIADALVVAPEDRENDFWNTSARIVLQGFVAWVAVEITAQSDRTLNLVWRLLNLPQAGFLTLLEKMIQRDEVASGVPSATAAFLQGMDERERAGVMATVKQHIAFLASPAVAEMFESKGRSLDFRQWKFGGKSVYLCLPAMRLHRHGRFFRLYVSALLNAVEAVKRVPEVPALFILDEMHVLGRMAALKTAAGLIAGYGIRIWSIWQDFAQLESIYGKRWETFIGNASILQSFGLNDLRTLKYMSERLGNSPTLRISYGEISKAQAAGGFSGESKSIENSPLASIDELAYFFSRQSANQLVVYPGADPIFMKYSAAIWEELARQSGWDFCVADNANLAA